MTAAAPTPHPARRTIATLALVFGLGAMIVEAVLAASGPATANHDIAWTLYAGGVLLDGGVFGRDLIDTNPPLIYWITALVVALSRALGVHPLQLWAAGTGLAIAVGAFWLRRHLQRVLPDSGLPEALALGTAVLLLSGSGFDVGQRDHLVNALLIPYLAVAVA